MRIRTQALLAILPLFVGLAAVIGVLSFSAARQEMIWGLEEEAKALSSTIAEFVDADAMGAATSPDDHLASLELPFRRILAFEQAKHIVVLDPGGEAIWSPPAPDAALSFLPPLALLRAEAEAASADAGAGVDAAAAWASEPYTLENNTRVMMGFAPILTSAGTSVGSVAVVVDAARLPALGRAMPLNLLRLTAVALAIGTLAALLISALLTRRVRALSRAAVEVANGAYDREIQVGTIQEVSDLSNTFNTMTSVLKDVIDRTQRTLVEGEQFRTPRDLARTYSEEDGGDLEWEGDGMQVASSTSRGGHPGDFVGVLELDGAVAVYLGRLERRTPLAAAIAAAAARRAIHEPAPADRLEERFARTARLLDARIETASWSAGTAAPILRAVYPNAGLESVRPGPDEDGQTLLMHTFDASQGAALKRWARIFAGLPPSEVVRNIAQNLDGESMGTLVAIGRLPLHAGSGPDRSTNYLTADRES